MKVFEGTEVTRLDVLRILQGDDVFPGKVLFTDQVPPIFRLDVQALDGIVGKDVAGVPEGYQMCVICEDFEGDWVHHFPIIVLGEV